MRENYPLTHRRLTDVLSYDRSTGVFTWRVKRGRIANIGDEAGTVTKNGNVTICIDGQIYPASRLAWFYVTKEWPGKRLGFRDGNPSNVAFSNLLDSPITHSQSPIAKYQRELRELNARVVEVIKADPELLERYNFSPLEAKRTMAMVRDEMRAREDYLHNQLRRRN